MNHPVIVNEAGTELHLTKPGSPFIVSLSEVATAESLLALIKRSNFQPLRILKNK